jgi:hypothetical protein
VLRVAVAHDEDDDGARDEPVVLVLIPVLRDQALDDQRVEVRLQREVDDVGGLAGDDRACLRLGRSVRLRELDVLARGCLLERGDELLEGLLRRGVGDEVERRALAGSRC